jgi:bifunctional DNase/RNase
MLQITNAIQKIVNNKQLIGIPSHIVNLAINDKKPISVLDHKNKKTYSLTVSSLKKPVEESETLTSKFDEQFTYTIKYYKSK